MDKYTEKSRKSYNKKAVDYINIRDLEVFCTNTGFSIESYNKIDAVSYIAKLRKD